jgi:hypothetical protein
MLSSLYALLVASSLAWAAPPAAPTLSAEELAVLASGEVLVRRGQGEGAPTMVVVDVAADPDTAFQAVMDVQARVGDISALKEAEVYLEEPGRLGVRWVMGIAGVNVEFSTLYVVDRAGRWCTYELDPSKPSSLKSSGGSYQVISRPGGSRIVYFAAVSAEGEEGWVRRQMQEKGTRSLLGGMKVRAEAAAARSPG